MFTIMRADFHDEIKAKQHPTLHHENYPPQIPAIIIRARNFGIGNSNGKQRNGSHKIRRYP